MTYGYYAILGILAWMITMCMLAVRLGRKMEVRADQAAGHAQSEDGSYARALEKIYRTNAMPAVLGRQPHPHLYDRLLAAGVTPDYPRPLPPPRRRGTLTAVLAFTLFGVALVTPRLALEFSIASDWRHPSAALAYLALGGSPEACSALGYGAWMKRDYAQAELFSRALMEAEPDRASGPARLALTLVKQGRCSEARLALIEAERRLEHDRYPDPNTMDQARTVVGNCAP